MKLKTFILVAAMVVMCGCETFEDGRDQTKSEVETVPKVDIAELSVYDAKDTDGPFGVYYSYKQLSIAKEHAIRESRPLLLVVSMNPCAHCDNFSRKILRTKQFREFVVENKIVVCETKDNAFLLKMKNLYRTGYGAYYSGAPHLYMFKVLSNSKSGLESFSKDQAELLKSSKLDKWFVGMYKSGGDFMGVNSGAESTWKPSVFIQQVQACFPNQHFSE